MKRSRAARQHQAGREVEGDRDDESAAHESALAGDEEREQVEDACPAVLDAVRQMEAVEARSPVRRQLARDAEVVVGVVVHEHARDEKAHRLRGESDLVEGRRGEQRDRRAERRIGRGCRSLRSLLHSAP
jgi:hypothetical protein